MTAVSTDPLEMRRAREAREPGRLRRLHQDHRAAIRGITAIVVVLGAWELIAQTLMADSVSLAAPSAIAAEYVRLAESGDLWRHISMSGREFLFGFLLAAVVGVTVGLSMGASRAVRDYADPLVSALYATPVIALGPLFILWMGIGIESKIAVVFILAVLPIVINTETGIRTVDRHLLETAHAFSATRMQMFRKVMLPAALPLILTGLRLGVGRGLLGVVAGELFAAQAGLGYLVLASSQVFNPAGVFVGITCLAFAGIVSMIFLRRVEKRLAPWREEAT
jgi:ABC-type nitrate/sulfonate/bicarbonate transport system permease component